MALQNSPLQKLRRHGGENVIAFEVKSKHMYIFMEFHLKVQFEK